MSAKPGRNEPCPCGSGKKYKRCCLEFESAESERELQADFALGQTRIREYEAEQRGQTAPDDVAVLIAAMAGLTYKPHRLPAN